MSGEKEGLWQILLVINVYNINTDMILVRKCPAELLENSPQPPTEQILSAYELKT